MRIKIDEEILTNLKKLIINYFNFGEDIINRAGHINLYVEDLQRALMVSRNAEIAIDKRFFIFDIKGNIIKFEPHLLKIIRSQLGHELFHLFSRSIKGNIFYSGINSYDSKKGSYINDYTGLNEGITQMFTEDVFGYVVSPFSDGYKDYKKITKIMRLCLGTMPFYNSYFYHTDDLRETCNALSGTNFYEKLNKTLTDLYYLKKLSFNKNELYKNLAYKIYNERIKLCYENVIIYLVIPKLKELKSEEAKKSFIKEILKVVSDDKEIAKEIEGLLKKTINLSSLKLAIEKDRIDLFDSQQQDKIKLINFELNNTSISLDEKGDLYYLNNGNYLSIKRDIDLCEYIYSNMYSYYFNSKIDLDNIIEQLKNGTKHPKIIFPKSYDIKKRRIMFSKIKAIALEKHNIIILNNYLECNQDNIKIEYVNKNFNLNDLKKLLNRYELQRKSFFDNISIIDKITKLPITNKNIIIAVRFAYLWLMANNGDFNLAFENKTTYNELINYLISNITVTGNLNYQKIYNYASKNDSNLAKILRIMFRNSTTYEWVFKFINTKNYTKKLNSEKEKSILENNTQYMDNILNETVEEILKRSK